MNEPFDMSISYRPPLLFTHNKSVFRLMANLILYALSPTSQCLLSLLMSRAVF